jgi:hypothetical protein
MCPRPARSPGHRREARQATPTRARLVRQRRRSAERSAAPRRARQSAATALTIVALALAIGVVAAIFSVVDQLILRPPPFLPADRLVNVWHQTGPNRSGGSGLTPEKIVGWPQQPAVVERLESDFGATVDLTESGTPEPRIDETYR